MVKKNPLNFLFDFVTISAFLAKNNKPLIP